MTNISFRRSVVLLQQVPWAAWLLIILASGVVAGLLYTVWGVAQVGWAGLVPLWALVLCGVLLRSRGQSSHAAQYQQPVCSSLTQGFATLDKQILQSVDKVSGLSAESIQGLIEQVEVLQQQSDKVVHYLADSGLESTKIQHVIGKNAQIIDCIYNFVGALQARVEEERLHSKQLVEEVEQFAEMTQVIRQIARQTDILAINARIEAARAGTAGQSFAVLAGEVRRLAMQSNESAVRIEQNIGVLLANVRERLGTDLESKIQSQELGSQNLLELTKELGESYTDIRDFYQMLLSAVTEHNISLNTNIQTLLDLGQYQDVFKQIIDRLHTVLEERHDCVESLLLSPELVASPQHIQANLTQIQAITQAYIDSEANHGSSGPLQDKHTGRSLERIELF